MPRKRGNREETKALPAKLFVLSLQDESLGTALAQNIRLNRERLGLFQTELAELVGTKASTLSNWEIGINRPDVTFLARLCRVFGISVDELLGIAAQRPRLAGAEQELLSNYRLMDTRGQELMLNMSRLELRQSEELTRKTEQNILQRRCFLARASAGTGDYLPEGDNYQWMDLVSTAKTRQADMVITVNGDSMEPDFYDGDMLLVEQTPQIKVGEIGIFILNGDGYVKELGQGCLVSHNSLYAPIVLKEDDDIRCVGRVLGRIEDGDIPREEK